MDVTERNERRGLRNVVAVEGVVAHGGMGQIWRATNLNPFGLLAELVINGEFAPEWVGLPDLPFEEPKGAVLPRPIDDPALIRRVYEAAEQLKAEHLSLAQSDYAKAKQQYDDLLEAIHPGLLRNPSIAVKVLRPVLHDERDRATRVKLLHEYGRRFIQENHMLRQLDHPGIVARYGLVNDPGKGWCMLLEYIQGENLEQVLKRQPQERLPLAQAARLALELAEALQHMHAKGIIHRDIKPANVMIDPEGRAVVTDFGIGKWTEHDLSMGAAVLGTPDYMAPEQLNGEATEATDVYQLGALLYRMVTGCRPYEEYDQEQISIMLSKRELDHPTYVFQLRPEIALEFETIIEKARDKNPEERWTVEELICELRELKQYERGEEPITTRLLRRRMKALKWHEKRIETKMHFVNLEARLAEAERLYGVRRLAEAKSSIAALAGEAAALGARYAPLKERIAALEERIRGAVTLEALNELLGNAERHAEAADHVACGSALRLIAQDLDALPRDAHPDVHRRYARLVGRFRPHEPFVQVFESVRKSFIEKVFNSVQEVYLLYGSGKPVEAEKVTALLHEVLTAGEMLDTIDPANVGVAYGKAVRGLAEQCAVLKDLWERARPAGEGGLADLIAGCEQALEGLRRKAGLA